MTLRVAVPSRGRLRDDVVALLDRAGYGTSAFRGTGARVPTDSLEFIEMRPRDAAAWLAAGRVEGAFISTDIVLEEGLGHLAAIPLGMTRSDLVVASRDDDGRQAVADLDGAVVATHMPKVTADWFGARGVAIKIVTMGGALEGVCAAGLADAIVDLRETGTSLSQNRLRVLDVVSQCEALFVHNDDGRLGALSLRLQAALDARQQRYVMLHIPRANWKNWSRSSLAWPHRRSSRWPDGTTSSPSISSSKQRFSGPVWARSGPQALRGSFRSRPMPSCADVGRRP